MFDRDLGNKTEQKDAVYREEGVDGYGVIVSNE